MLADERFQGAAPLGGNFGDGMGTNRLRKMMRAGMKSNASSAITPRLIRMNGRIVARGLAPELDGSLELLVGVDEPPGPWFVPVPSVLVFVLVGVAPPVGEATTVGDVLGPTVDADVGDGKILRVALGEGAGVVVGAVG